MDVWRFSKVRIGPVAENASSIICLPSIPPQPTSKIYFHRTRNGPQLRQMANGSSDQFSEESRGKVQKFMFVIFISNILMSKTNADFLSFFSSIYKAEFWQTFCVIWENGSNWSNLRLKMSVSALGRLKRHNVPRLQLHPNFTMFMPLNRLQLKICPEMKFIAILRFKLISQCVCH